MMLFVPLVFGVCKASTLHYCTEHAEHYFYFFVMEKGFRFKFQMNEVKDDGCIKIRSGVVGSPHRPVDLSQSRATLHVGTAIRGQPSKKTLRRPRDLSRQPSPKVHSSQHTTTPS